MMRTLVTAKNEDIERVMEENRVALNAMLPAYSQISKMKIYPEEFEKTPKKSIKRYLYQEAKAILGLFRTEKKEIKRKRNILKMKIRKTILTAAILMAAVCLPAQNKSAGINISIWKDSI